MSSRYPARIKVPASGELHQGATFDSIARRVWGRRSFIQLSADPNNRFGDMTEGMVLLPASTGGYHVLARVLCWVEGE